jgi:hypothetical protein
MGRRVWEYNVQTCCLYGTPVYSFVIYLLPEENIVEPPYQLSGPDGRKIHLFQFENVKLWEIEKETLIRTGLTVLLPLLPLTREGRQYDTVDEMMTLLREAGNQDLLVLGCAFAAQVFVSDAERTWLKERIVRMQELLEDNWFFQEIIEKGLMKGLEQGIQQGKALGLEQGMQQGLEQGLNAFRSTVLHFVDVRYQELIPLAQPIVAHIQDMSLLQHLMDQLIEARSSEEAKQALLRAASSNDGQSS